ncbi:LysM peptidoglycan-binding domain-containing protein [Mycolicibacillus trivialis]|uniref:Lectin n=1 Tax=Mycolicibacillus trivialis TaxID=1798 RepID=A0A1X2EFS5_9MYCO|nr:LysM peptidoglycan-binding domain-containing protein [Mycolicibacillus trivialis]ORX00530.1 lectin [Mycolicibacillus trivialis]
MADTLNAGEKLTSRESLISKNGAYQLTLQDDGNLVLTENGKPVWASGTNGKDVVRAEVQKDGNFVLYTPKEPVWHTDTKGKKDVKLVLQDDRNLVLYAADGPVWSSKTATSAAPAAPEAKPAAAEKPAEQPAAPPAPPVPRTHTVVSGDTLWAIAEKFYGDGNKYQQIADANGIANPDLIHPGQELTIP